MITNDLEKSERKSSTTTISTSTTSVIVIATCVYFPGAVKYYHDAPTERSGLLSLAVTLIALYFIWITVCLMYGTDFMN